MFNSRQAWLVLGIVLGLIVGLNLAGIWPQIPVQATATHGQDGFAVATGPLSGDIEAVYVLDYLTGDLKAAVINLQTGQFMTAYEYNVTKDLAGANPKGARYAMVTGVADLRRGGLGQMGQSVVYVAEFTSGKLAAYGVPWTVGRENMLTAFKGSLILLNIVKFRTVEVRK
jgi:hypothetical protein